MSAIPTAPSLEPATIGDAMSGGAMSIDQFCQYGCIGKTKAYGEVKAGRLELRKIGSKTVVLRSEAERWLRSLPTATAAADLDRETA